MVAHAFPHSLEELHMDSFSCTATPPQPCPTGFLNGLETAVLKCSHLKEVHLELQFTAMEAAHLVLASSHAF